MEQACDLLQALGSSYQDIGRPGRVLVAFSGGADSTALLHLLNQLRQQQGFELFCLHIHHGLRQASDLEEQYASRFSKKQDVPFFCERVQVKQEGNLEDAARQARYAAIDQYRQQLQADVVALGHHADDQTETMLLHLMSGCGLNGLAAMPAFSVPFWRPLLPFSKTQIVHYLESQQLSWVEDESNRDLSYARNRLRALVLPQLEAMAPGATRRMARTAGLLMDEERAWEAQTRAFLADHAKQEPPFCFILRAPLTAQSAAFQRRLLRSICQAAGIPMNYDQTEALRRFALAGTGRQLNLPRNARAVLSKERLHILPFDVELLKVCWPQPVIQEGTGSLGDGRHSQAVDAAVLAGAQMRRAHPGDFIRPLGMQGNQPLRKFLSARGIDPPFRPFWPVLARGSEVLWVPGAGISATAALTQQTQKPCMLHFQARLPDQID